MSSLITRTFTASSSSGSFTTVYHGKRQVAHIDGQPQPLGEVQAGLAAAQLGLVGDVIVDEGR